MNTQINKAILVPIIASALQAVNLVFNKHIDQSWVDITATAILFAIQVAGIFIHPKKEKVVSDEIVTYEVTSSAPKSDEIQPIDQV